MDGPSPPYTSGNGEIFAETFRRFLHRLGGGGEDVDLRNNQITVRELLSNPAAKQVLTRRFPQVIDLPIVKALGGMPLSKVMELGAKFVPRAQIQAAWQELKRL